MMETWPRELDFAVSGINAAIALAHRFKDAGHFDAFRGQRSDWLLVPTLYRPGVDTSLATTRIATFDNWVQNNPELASLHGNQDRICAVAQHYGFPTPFLDFSIDPRVAAYFAINCQPSAHVDGGDKGCIICINSASLEDTWRDANDFYQKKAGFPLVRIVKHFPKKRASQASHHECG